MLVCQKKHLNHRVTNASDKWCFFCHLVERYEGVRADHGCRIAGRFHGYRDRVCMYIHSLCVTNIPYVTCANWSIIVVVGVFTAVG